MLPARARQREGGPVSVHHADGAEDRFPVNHTCNAGQIEWFKAGSALNLIRKHGSS